MFSFFLRTTARRPAPQRKTTLTHSAQVAHLRAMVEAIGGDPDDIAPEGARD